MHENQLHSLLFLHKVKRRNQIKMSDEFLFLDKNCLIFHQEVLEPVKHLSNKLQGQDCTLADAFNWFTAAKEVLLNFTPK